MVKELSPALKKKYRELRAFHVHQYRITGRMHVFSVVVRECMTERYPRIPGASSNEVIKARDEL